jgi:acetylornithine deacetylase/succinyl-diaminopimelate desuccinylase family protein
MKELLELINVERLNKLAGDLIRIPSVNPPGNTEACVDRLIEYFDRNGIHGQRICKFEGKPNLVITIGGGSPVLLWNGHLDVVTAGEEKWEHDPFGGTIEGDCLHGRGAVDMKASVAAMAEAFLALTKCGKNLKGTLIFTAVSDEENLGGAGTQVLADEGKLQADFAIVGEPTNLRVDVVERGVMWFSVISHGRTSHGARPHLGVNAVEQMVDVAKALKDRVIPKLKQRTHPLVSSACMSLNLFHGGEKNNVIPDYCKMSGDRRIVPGEKGDEVAREIEEIIREYRTPENRLEFIVDKLVLPTETRSDHPIVQILLKNIERVTGEKKIVGGKDGSTDAHIINAKLGIPSVIFGPGDFTLCHRPNEYVSLKQLMQAAQIHLLTALDLLG